MADLSPIRLAQSLGIMVNYRYVLDKIDHNSLEYIQHGTIVSALGGDVKAKL
jgi:hypothetical protein